MQKMIYFEDYLYIFFAKVWQTLIPKEIFLRKITMLKD
jgi:hypothetical protein